MVKAEKTPQNQTQTPESSQSEGLSMAPPAFQLKASPVQMQDGEGETTNTADTGTTPAAPTIDAGAAATWNTNKEFRLDWVRNLQLSLIGARRSTDGSFDEETANAVAQFQAAQGWTGNDVDGKIGENTRRALEQTYPVLLTTITGAHTDMRTLVPAGANDEQKYAYYRSILQDSGSVFLTGAMQINLLGIRGVKRATADNPGTINGQAVPEGTLYQTSSAQDFDAARTAGTDDDHMRFSATEGYDDMIISLWVDEAGQIQVRERRGSVDPASNYNKDSFGTGHLRDGQYPFELGRHGTSSGSHIEAVDRIAETEGGDSLNISGSGGSRQYDALTPTRNQEVWRNYDGRRRDNNRMIENDEEAESNERIYKGHNRFVNDNFAINIHTARETAGNSVACQNVPEDLYVEFMNEIQGASNTGNILYTLIDASKIENGLQMQNQMPDIDLGPVMEGLRWYWGLMRFGLF